MRRLAAAVWSALLLLVMLAGLPWALVVVFGTPFPRHLPQQQYLHEWIISVGALLLWSVWLGLLVMLGMQVGAAVRRLRMPTPRLANPPEGLLAGLVGALVAAYATAASRGTAPAPPPPAAAATLPPAVADQVPAGGAAVHGPAATAGRQPDLPAEARPLPGAAPVDRPARGDSAGPASAPVSGSVDPAGGPLPGAGRTPLDPGFERPNGGHTGAARGGDPGRQAQAGVDLPGGGWVSRDTARAVTAAAGLLWLRRRRRYRPGSPTVSGRRDADLTGLPDTVAAVVDSVEVRDLHDLDADAQLHAPTDVDPVAEVDAPTDVDPVADRDRAVGERAPGEGPDRPGGGRAAGPRTDAGPGLRVAPGRVAPASLGYRRDGPLQPADLPAAGVGLTGPGAGDAARGVLVATLLAGGPGDPGLDAQVLTTGADLRALLGPGPVGHGRPPGLNVFDGLAAVLPVLETQVLTRSRALAGLPPLAGDTEPPTTLPQGVFPPLLLLAAAPAERGLARRLAVLLLSPRELGVAGLLLGWWRHGPTWRVDPDGTTHPQALPTVAHLSRWAVSGGRLCMLPAAAAADLLLLQAAARPRRGHLYHPPPPAPVPPVPPVPPSRAPVVSVAASSASVAGDAQESVRHAGPAGGSGLDRPLRLRLLGPVALCHVRDPGTPLRLGRFTAVQVLLYLAVHRDGATSTEVAAALWPGVRPYPVDRVYRAASALRSAVHHATGVHLLTRVGDRYRLDPDRVQVDLWQLHAAVDHAATATDPHTRTGALHTVIDAYTGDLAAGQPGAWLVPHREAARRHAMDAYTTLAALSDPLTAAALLDRALRVDPYNEYLHRAAAHAHQAAGNPDVVRPRLAELARRLADIDDDPPAPDTVTSR